MDFHDEPFLWIFDDRERRCTVKCVLYLVERHNCAAHVHGTNRVITGGRPVRGNKRERCGDVGEGYACANRRYDFYGINDASQKSAKATSLNVNVSVQRARLNLLYRCINTSC